MEPKDLKSSKELKSTAKADAETAKEKIVPVDEKTTETVQFYLPSRAESGTFEMLDRMGKSYMTFSTLEAFTVTPNETGYIYTLSLNTSAYPVGDYLLRITAVMPDTSAPYIEMIRARIVPLVFWILYPSYKFTCRC